MNETVHLDDLIDPSLLAEMISGQYVNVTHHPSAHLRILNYGPRAQYDNVWNAATLQCRGLIVSGPNRVHARPFRKFFNLGQLASVPDGPFVAHEKMDGSLGIGYLGANGRPAIATRGSFTSEQALWATEWLSGRPDYEAWCAATIADGITPLFEIIYPANRIVVDYGERAELVHLANIDVATGVDVDRTGWPGATATEHDGLDLATITSMQRPNSEGFVLRWQCGTRAKVKFNEYVRLHRLLTVVNARTIWELLSTGQTLDELLDVVPDEFYQWVHAVVADLHTEYERIDSAARATLSNVDRRASRREQAETIKTGPYPGITFALLDGKNASDKIWRMIRPSASRPFRCDGDA